MTDTCRVCTVRPVHGRGLCEPHYWQQRRGKPFTEPGSRHWPSRVFHDGESWCVETLDRTRQPTGLLRISAEDVPRVRAFRWCRMTVGVTSYGIHPSTRPPLLLHRFILGAKPGEHVHHRNGDGTDNRRANLVLLAPTDHKRHHANACARRSNGQFASANKMEPTR